MAMIITELTVHEYHDLMMTEKHDFLAAYMMLMRSLRLNPLEDKDLQNIFSSSNPNPV